MKLWEIRESAGKYDSDYRMGMKHKNKLQEAYDCGFEDGYKKAIEDYEDGKMDERSNYRDSDEMDYKRRR